MPNNIKTIPLPTLERKPARALWLVFLCAIIASLACGWLAYGAIRTWLADRQLALLQNSPALSQTQAVRLLDRARRARPDLSNAWRVEAQLQLYVHVRFARQLALQAVRINSQNWKNWRTLGMIEFQLGDMHEARHDLSLAARYNRGYEAHFELANICWIMGEKQSFWREMTLALQMVPPDKISATIYDILHLTGARPESLLSMLPHRPSVILEAAYTLRVSGHLMAATQLWSHLQCPRWEYPACMMTAFELVHGWITRAQAQPLTSLQSTQQALQIWNKAIVRRFFQAAPAQFGQIADGDFQYPQRGMFSWSHPDAFITLRGQKTRPFLEVHFSGWEHSPLPISYQWVPVQPLVQYRASFITRGGDLNTNSGVELVAETPKGQTLAEIPATISSDWEQTTGSFQVPSGICLIHLGLQYRRKLGTIPLKGRVQLTRVQLERLQLQPRLSRSPWRAQP